MDNVKQWEKQETTQQEKAKKRETKKSKKCFLFNNSPVTKCSW